MSAEPADPRPDPQAEPVAARPPEVAALEAELSAFRLARGATRSDGTSRWWVLVLLAGGVAFWGWTIWWAWPTSVVSDLR